MKNQEKKIFVTLGPSTLNKKFLEFAKNEKISFLRLNMSHIKIKNLQKTINFIKKHNNNTPICIDTEGAQIRTSKIKNITKVLKKDNFIYINKDNIKVVRPNFGLAPKYYDIILGKRFKKNIKNGSRLTLSMIEGKIKKPNDYI